MTEPRRSPNVNLHVPSVDAVSAVGAVGLASPAEQVATFFAKVEDVITRIHRNVSLIALDPMTEHQTAYVDFAVSALDEMRRLFRAEAVAQGVAPTKGSDL